MIDLKKILDTYPNCLISRSTLRSHLLDMFPSDKRSANILASIYECGIAQKIKGMKFLTDHDVQAFSEQLDREYGINSKYTTEYILIWADAYEVNFIEINPQTHETPQNCTKNGLANYFESCGFEIIDKRQSGGCLWVVGEKAELESYVTKAKELFSLTDGGYAKGRATGGRHGWYTASKK